MTRTVLIFGSISGLVIISTMIAGFVVLGTQNHQASQWLGYLTMIVALSMIFIGVKRHRDGALGGVIKFLPALFLGFGIAGVATVAYVAAWEGYLALTDYAFIDDYTAALLETQRAAGVAGAELEAEIARMDAMREQYGNLLFRLPITALEIIPVGTLVSVISAALLRNPRVLPARG